MKNLFYFCLTAIALINFSSVELATADDDDILLYLPAIIHKVPSKPRPRVPPIVTGNSIITIFGPHPIYSGFFSLGEHRRVVYAGTYCFPWCEINSIGYPATLHNNDDIRHGYGINTVEESIYDLYSDSVTGLLFISCENGGGRVYTWNPEQPDPAQKLQLFWKGHLDSTLATRRIFNKLVTLSGDFNKQEASIHIHGEGTPHLPGSGTKFIRDIVVFKGKALIMGFDYADEVGGWYESTDLYTWKWRPLWPNMRFLRAKVAEKGTKLYIAGSPFTDGERHGPGVLIQAYSLDGVEPAGQFPGELVFGFDVDQYSGAVYVGAHMGWRDAGSAGIWRYYAGQWKQIATLNEAETPALMINNQGLFVATRQEGGRGRVYLIR